NQNGDPNPRYQLRGKPISANKDIQRKWVVAIRAIKFNVHFKPLHPDKSEFGCVWCKGEDHPGYACPYPDYGEEKWLGPTKEQLTSIMNNPSDWKKKEQTTSLGEQSNSTTRGRGYSPRGRASGWGAPVVGRSRGRGQGGQGGQLSQLSTHLVVVVVIGDRNKL
ncbi:hypothetical protein F5890DRAFT_1478814, partial [Lentinula detonsa]